MSEPSVCFGCAAVRNTALERKWSAPTSSAVNGSAPEQSVWLTTVRWSRNGSSGVRIFVNSKSRPVVVGVHRWLVVPYSVLPALPCTISMPVKRLLGSTGGALGAGGCAGTIASSSGRATVAPMPRSTVRRDSARLVMNIS